MYYHVQHILILRSFDAYQKNYQSIFGTPIYNNDRRFVIHHIKVFYCKYIFFIFLIVSHLDLSNTLMQNVITQTRYNKDLSFCHFYYWTRTCKQVVLYGPNLISVDTCYCLLAFSGFLTTIIRYNI